MMEKEKRMRMEVHLNLWMLGIHLSILLPRCTDLQLSEHILTETENSAQFGTVSAVFAAIMSEIQAVNTVQMGRQLKEAVLDGKYNSVNQRAKGVEEASQDGRTATLRRLAASLKKDHDLEVSRLKTAQFKELLKKIPEISGEITSFGQLSGSSSASSSIWCC